MQRYRDEKIRVCGKNAFLMQSVSFIEFYHMLVFISIICKLGGVVFFPSKRIFEDIKAEREKANEQRLNANKQRLKANKQRLKANKQRLKANKQRLKANKQRLKANKQRLKANKQRFYRSESKPKI